MIKVLTTLSNNSAEGVTSTGLLKTPLALSGTLQVVEDYAGTDSPLYLSTTQAKFQSNRTSLANGDYVFNYTGTVTNAGVSGNSNNFLTITPTFDNTPTQNQFNNGVYISSTFGSNSSTYQRSNLHLQSYSSAFAISFGSTAASRIAGIIADAVSGEIQYYHSSGGYFPTFYSNGVEVMRITTAGNVGIGTTSPTGTLHVVNSTGYLAKFVTATGNANLLMQRTGGTASVWEMYLASGTTSFRFYNPVGVDVLTLGGGATGLVGVNNTSPTAQLDVVAAATTVGLYVKGAASTNVGEYYTSTPAEVMTVGVSGGNTTRFNGAVRTNTINTYGNTASIIANSSGGATAASTIIYDGEGNATIYIKNITTGVAGNVGIGTSTPTSKLTIFDANAQVLIDSSGTVDGASGITFRINSPNWASSINTHTSAGGVNVGLQFKSNGQLNCVMNSTGNTYFGTVFTIPTARLQVKGSGSDSTTTSLLVQNSLGTASLTVRDDGTVYIYQNSSNSVNDLEIYHDYTSGATAYTNLTLTTKQLNGNHGSQLINFKHVGGNAGTFIGGAVGCFLYDSGVGGYTEFFIKTKRSGESLEPRFIIDSNGNLILGKHAATNEFIYIAEPAFVSSYPLPTRTITIKGNNTQAAGWGGYGLTIKAGNANNDLSSNLKGGELYLRSGESLGTGVSDILFQVPIPAGAPSTTLNSTYQTAMFISGNTKIGINNTSPTAQLDIVAASSTVGLSVLGATQATSGTIGTFLSTQTSNATSGTLASNSFVGTFAAAAGSASFRPISATYTINNSGAQSGTTTGIFLNATETALNSMTHNLMDLQVGGSSKFKVDNAGNVTIGGNWVSGSFLSSIAIGGSSYLIFNSSYARMQSSAANRIILYNQAVNGFDMLQFGGTTTSFPALKRSTTNLQVRLADDSGYATIDAESYKVNGTAGFTGTGIFTSFTIEGGIITAAS